MGQSNAQSSAQEFKIEEFKQLHEHIRNFETTLGTICTGSLAACTALLTAIFGWLYGSEGGRLATPLCYIFLCPALLSVLALFLISSYKSAIYRNGFYIKVFFEEAGTGAQWHLHLVKFRTIKTSLVERILGEHGDPAALMFWPLFVISIGLYVGSLWSIRPSHDWNIFGLVHFVSPGILVLLMVVAHFELVSTRKRMEDVWHTVQRQMSTGQTAERPGGTSA